MKRSISWLVSLSLIIAVIFNVPTIPQSSFATAAKDSEIGSVQCLRAACTGSNSLKLKWQMNQNAGGYIIYRYDRVKKKYTIIARIAGRKHTSYTDNGLNRGQVYKYKVRPYKKVHSKMVYGNSSYWVKARSYAKNDKEVNAGRITVRENSLTMGFIGSVKAFANVSAGKSSKAKEGKSVTKTVRWRSSNKTIATVDSKGVIRTKANNGTCYIYAIAHNGIRAKISVKVKDFATPKAFDLTEVQGSAQNLLRDYRVELGQIAKYFHIYRPPGETTFDFDDEDGFFVNPGGYEVSSSVKDVLCRVMGKFNNDERAVIVTAYKKYLTFTISDVIGVASDGSDINAHYNVYYYYNRDMYDFDIEDYDFYEIAPHWSFVALSAPENSESDDE
jgi:hypothetical protein